MGLGMGMGMGWDWDGIGTENFPNSHHYFRPVPIDQKQNFYSVFDFLIAFR
jgi:hypothetical protein